MKKSKGPLRKGWDWLTETNQKKLSFLAAPVLAVAGYFGFSFASKEEAKPGCVEQTADAQGAVAANNCGSGTVTIVGAPAPAPVPEAERRPVVQPAEPAKPSGQNARAVDGAAAVNNSGTGTVSVQLQAPEAQQPSSGQP